MIISQVKKKCTYNYRPVSLTTLFSKVIKKVMYNILCGHLYSNNILVEEQFGFKKNLTTEKATYELINEIVSALNNKLILRGIFCDLVKAFDYDNHHILLSKLNFYGITGTAYKWIKSHLRNRYQSVEIKNKKFNHKTFQTGEL
jgi:Reverse transcriptase (RNA-dependent DNA polymerase).